jgi:hypothetical protein
MNDLKPRTFARWAVVATMLVPVVLYHAFFWSLKDPPGRPPFNGDGDWAKLGYVVGLPFLVGIVGLVGLSARRVFRNRLSDSTDEGRG